MKKSFLLLMLSLSVTFIFAQSFKSDSLFAIGVDLYQSKKFAEAIAFFLKCDSLDSDLGQSCRSGYGKMWAANSYYQNGDVMNASKLYSNYMIHPIDRRMTLEADTLFDAAISAYNRGNFERALEIGKESLNLYQAISKNHLICSNLYKFMASCAQKVGKYEDAIILFENSMRIRYANLKKCDRLYLEMVSTISSIYYSKFDRSDKAIEVLKDAELLLEENLDKVSVFDRLYLYGCFIDLYKRLRQYDLTTKYIRIAKRIVIDNYGEKSIEYSKLLFVEGDMYVAKGYYSRGIECYTRGLEIVGNTAGKKSPSYVEKLEKLGGIYSSIHSDKGKICFQEACSIRKELYGEDASYAWSLAKLGELYIGDSTHVAKQFIERSLLILDSLGYSKHPGYDEILIMYSNVLNAIGDFNESLLVLYDILQKQRINDSLKIIGVLDAIADTHLLSGTDLDEGKRMAEKVLKLVERINSDASTLYLKKCYERLLTYAYVLEDKKGASEYARKAVYMYKEIILNNLFKMPVSERLNFYLEAVDWFRYKLTLLWDNNEGIFSNIGSDYMYDAALISKGLMTGSEKDQVEATEFRYFETNWADVKNSLSSQDIAIEFYWCNMGMSDTVKIYNAIVLKKNYDSPKILPLFEVKNENLHNSSHDYEEMSKLIWGTLSEELNDISNIYFSPDGMLYNLPIETFSHWKNKGSMSDYYNLYRLSSTRELAKQKKYKKIKVASVFGGVNYDSDLDFLAADGNNYQTPNRIRSIEELAIADSLNLRSGVSYLPATKNEVEDIDRTLESAQINTRVLIDSLATEGAFKDLSGKNTNLIHIATHGFYWTEKELKYKDKLDFLSFDDNHKKYVEDKALTRSGLLLAGANIALKGKKLPEGVDDGILTAKEIAQLDLRGLDLVVLSACQTGLGEIKGDGVFGLQRGFKKAGANSILMSLWKVDDKATSLLMMQFYKNITSGMSKYESLKQAQRYVREYEEEVEIKSDARPSISAHAKEQAQQNATREKTYKKVRKYEDPYYWAAFILLDALD